MSDVDASGLWPKPDTLAAGDEELVKPRDHPASGDWLNDDWPRARPFQEDGHLAADAYRKEHPDDADDPLVP